MKKTCINKMAFLAYFGFKVVILSSSCNYSKEIKGDNNESSSTLRINEDTNTIIESNKAKEPEDESHNVKPDSVYSLLIKNRIIPLEFPPNLVLNEVVINKENESILGFYQLEFHNSMLSYSDDPVYNVLYFVQSNELVISEVLPSVYPEDFSFEYSLENLFFFIDYSSPAGLSRFIIVDIELLRIYESDWLNEEDFMIVDKESFDLKIRQFFLNNGTKKSLWLRQN